MNLKKLLLTLLIINGLSVQANAQNKVDSLKNLLPTDHNEYYVSLLLEIANSFARKNNDSLRHYALEAFHIAKELKNDSLIANAKQLEGIGYFYSADYSKAQLSFNDALQKYELLNDSIKAGILLSNMGVCNVYQTNFEEAIKQLIRSRAFLAPKNHPKLASAINNIGLAYYRMEDMDRALSYYIQAAKLKEQYGLRRSLTNTLNNIGIIYKNKGYYDSALFYYNKSLEIAIESNELVSQANAYNNLAIIYELNNDMMKAEESYYKAIELKKTFGDNSSLLNSYNNLASALVKQNKLRKAKKMLDTADSLALLVGDDHYTSYALTIKAEYYSAIGNYKEAYELTEKAMVRRIDEVNEDRNQRIAEWEVKYETVQKESEITKLSLENDLQAANLAKSRNAVIGLTAGGSLVVILLIVFFTLRSKKIKAEKEAQELQMEALKKRFIELHSSPAELAVSLKFEDLNDKLNTELTEREFEALKLSLEGKTNTEIADQLFISVSTVKFHLRNTYSKMGVGNRKEAFQLMLKTS